MLRKILIACWTLWSLLVITILVICMLPFFAVMVNSGVSSWKVAAHKLVGLTARTILFFWGVRVVEHHPEVIDPERQYVYVCNHRSDLDPLVALTIMRGYFKFLGKAELLSWPLIGYLVGQIYVTVSRADQRSRGSSIRQMMSKLKDGASIMIYPEGWSNFTNEYLIQLNQGAFRLAIASRLPMAVMTITGSFDIWRKPGWRIVPGRVHVYWERVIDTHRLEMGEKEDFEWLKKEVSGIWLDRLRQVYPDGYTGGVSMEEFLHWKAGQLGRKV